MTARMNPRVVILIVSIAVGLLAAIGLAVFLLTGRSETTIQGAIIGEPVSIELPVAESATVTHESGARIEVPAGATSGSTTVSVAEVVPPESDLEVQRAFDFSVGAVELLRPVTIHIPFDLETGADTSAVHALHWNEEAVDWEPVPGTVDESSRTISVTTSNLSVFSWAWVKVDANCDVNPSMVDVGEGFTVTAAGTSLTSGNIKVYMKPDLQGPVDLPDQPEAKSETAVVGMGERFQLNVASALEIPTEHLIHCRIFWETIGPDVELNSQEPLAAILDVKGEGQFMHRVDLALKAEDILQFPVYVGEGFGIGLEVENLGEEPSIPFDLVAYFTSVVDGSVKRVDSIDFGHSQEVAVGAGESHLLKFDGLAPNDLLTGDYVVCVEIQHADASSRDLDTSNDRACLDKYVMHFVEGAMPIYTTLTETKAGHRVWTGVPSGSGLEPDAGFGFADDSGIRDDETLKRLYKRLAAEIAFRKALQPEGGEQHVFLEGLMDNISGPAEIVGYINDFCGQLDCETAIVESKLLESGLLEKLPHASHEAIGFAGQSISGGVLFGDIYFSMLVNQALDMHQARETLNELWLLPLGPLWKEAVEEARDEVAIMDSNRWNATALEIVNRKDDIGKFAFTTTVGGLTKYAVKKQLLHHLGITAQKALAHALGVKIAGGAAATTGVGGAAAAAGPVLFVASVWFAAEVYSDVQENQDQIGVATLASFLNAAFNDPSHKPELREAIAYAKYVAYDNFYNSDEGILQDIASWITFSSGDRDEFLKYTKIERNKALEEVKNLVSVASVEVSPESLTLAVGDTEKLRGSATTGSGRIVSSQDFEWSSSAPGIAAVSEEGVVTGVGPGEATISVSVGGIRSSARVSVDVDTELPLEPPPTVTIGPTWTQQPPPEQTLSNFEGFNGLAEELSAAGNDLPWGIWSDWVTMWVADSEDAKIYAYDLRTKERRDNLDFNTLAAAGNANPISIWSDGETMWVLDVEDRIVYAYHTESKARDGAKELYLWNHLRNSYVRTRSIWSDGETMWVSAYQPGGGSLPRIYAFDMKTKQRVSDKDFVLSFSQRPEGIWSNGETMWVADSSARKIYAYDMQTKAPVPAKEFETLGVGASPYAIWSNGPTMLVLHLHSSDGNAISAFNMPTSEGVTVTLPRPIVDTPAFDRNPAGDFTELSDAGNDLPWGIWSDWVTMWVADSEDAKIYAYDLRTKERRDNLDFNTLAAAGNANPISIWSDGETMWVLDVEDRNVYAYHTESKARDGAKELYLRNHLRNSYVRTRSIWSDGETMWVSAYQPGGGSLPRIYAFDMKTKQRVSDKDFVLSFSQRPEGIWSNGETMWVADSSARKIYAYDMQTKAPVPAKEFETLGVGASPYAIWSNGPTMLVLHLHSSDGNAISAFNMPTSEGVTVTLPRPIVDTPAFDRNPAGDFTELSDAGNDLPWGIWSDWVTMWVADSEDAKIYAYDLRTKERRDNLDFNTLAAAGNANPISIWSDGETMWVLDVEDRNVYAYHTESKARDGAKELYLRNHLRNSYVRTRSIWSDGETMWVSAYQPGGGSLPRIYAFDMKTKQRVSDKDFVLSFSQRPEGIWSNGETMWVADSSARKIYAYDMQTKAPVPAKEFETLGVGASPYAIWSNGPTMLVLHLHSSDGNAISAFNMPTSEGVTVTLPTAAQTTEGGATSLTRNRVQHLSVLLGGEYGIWSDRPTIWVSNNPASVMYTHSLATTARVERNSLNFFCSAKSNHHGSICTHGKMLCAMESTGIPHILAYEMATRMRVPDREFDTLTGTALCAISRLTRG